MLLKRRHFMWSAFENIKKKVLDISKSTRILCLALFFLMFVLGSCQQKIICDKPYILIGNSCCLDKNDNKICDNDEPEEFQKNGTIAIDGQKLAETSALRFERAWEAKDWSPIYDLFTDSLKKLKSKERFTKIATRFSSGEKPYIIRLNDIKLSNESMAYAYYTKYYSGTGTERKEPAIKLMRAGNEWKVEAFMNYFNACDEFSKECCGNKLCEKDEGVHSLNNHIRCSSDCFQLERYVDKNKKEADFSFLGNVYHFQILNFTESEKEGNILKLKYNGKEYTLDESSYGDYPIDDNIGGNVYVKFRYLDNVITITLFNKDK